MFVGVSDDGLKWRTSAMVPVLRDLGVRAVRITLSWRAGQTQLTAFDADQLNRAVVGGGGVRIVLAVYSRDTTPTDEASRSQYCDYVRGVLTQFPQINDVVIWNEPNLAAFWSPQYSPSGASAAPAAYTELLARCWDVLHGLRPSVNLIAAATSLWGNDNPNAFSNVSHSPARFIRNMGAAYRASGRGSPLFDTVGHHPYPQSSSERPWKQHADEAIMSLGDYDRLLGALQDAYAGTAQPLPGNGVSIWYLETGYQTTIAESKRRLYSDVENWPGAVPDVADDPGPPAAPPDDSPAPDQATQLRDSLRLTYCQPYIGAVFNFLLWDEHSLLNWQSGVLWADGTPKRSYGAFRNTVAEVNERRVDCGRLRGAPGVGPAGAQVAGSPASAKPAAARAVTKLTYLGTRRAPYGFLHLRAGLTRGVQRSNARLAAKQVSFTVGGETFVTKTNRAGTASLAPLPPLRPGRHRVAARFTGDERHLGSGVRATLTAINSRGRLATRGWATLRPTLAARLSVRSNGRKVRGTLVLRQGGATRTVRLTAFGLRRDGRAAWLAGTRGGVRYVVHADDRRGGAADRLRVWRNDSLLNGVGLVGPRRLTIHTR